MLIKGDNGVSELWHTGSSNGLLPAYHKTIIQTNIDTQSVWSQEQIPVKL